MCGIAGILSLSEKPIDQEVLFRMNVCQKHRGPDADGTFLNQNIGLAHTRLSIIDLSTLSNQPFSDSSGRYTIVFNGELYNYREVRSQLVEYNFITQGDTEVVLAAFIRWGRDCVANFKGMFAFAIWDKADRELTLIRDRLGVKPLYIYRNAEYVVFASEIRAILATGIVPKIANRTALAEYFRYQSIGSGLSAIDGVHAVKAGSCLTMSKSKMDERQYWHPTQSNVTQEVSSLPVIRNNIRTLLTESVRQRMVSDVPVAAFLSGGIDSTAIVGIMAEVSERKPTTFTISFEEKDTNESAYADLAAKTFNTDHIDIRLEPQGLLDDLPNALQSMDTPTGDGVNTYIISKAVRERGIKVALSGVGGDELFAGYPIFSHFARLRRNRGILKVAGTMRSNAGVMLRKRQSSKMHRIGQLLQAKDTDIEHAYPILRQILSPEMIARLTNLDAWDTSPMQTELHANREALVKLPILSQVSVAEYLGYTQHTLLKDIDQMSMAVGLEVREPFFDHQLIEYVLAIPDRFKKPTFPKSLLVESLSSMIPEAIVHRPKQGFQFPWATWMRGPLKDFCEVRIKAICERDFINDEALLGHWRAFLHGNKSARWSELWLFVVLESWLELNGVN